MVVHARVDKCDTSRDGAGAAGGTTVRVRMIERCLFEVSLRERTD